MSRSPPSSFTGTVIQSHFQSGNLISHLILSLPVTSSKNFISFPVEWEIFILLFCVATKAYTTRCCSSRQARISHPQGSLWNGGNMAPAGTCSCSPLPAGLRCFSLGRVRPWGLCRQVRHYFSSKEKASFHKQGVFVNIKSGVNVVKFDYLQLHPKQINWDA